MVFRLPIAFQRSSGGGLVWNEFSVALFCASCFCCCCSACCRNSGAGYTRLAYSVNNVIVNVGTNRCKSVNFSVGHTRYDDQISTIRRDTWNQYTRTRPQRGWSRELLTAYVAQTYSEKTKHALGVVVTVQNKLFQV